jgi:hypothetical protein
MPHQILTDLLNEMESKCISDTFEIEGHFYEMQLLNSAEDDWRNKHISIDGTAMSKASLNIAMLSGVKRPTLAIGIRSIDGARIEELFEEEWLKLKAETRTRLLIEDSDARKWHAADCFLKNMSNWPGEARDELWDKWDELLKRRQKAKEELKKSSGESEKTDQTSTTHSPTGEK